jgi:hypothetical protein
MCEVITIREARRRIALRKRARRREARARKRIELLERLRALFAA